MADDDRGHRPRARNRTGMRPLRHEDPAAIAGFRLVARLGSGGMGTVYLSHMPDGRPTALKTVRAELAEAPDFHRQFEREVRAASRVRGRYVVPVLRSDTDGPVPWLATAYVPGASLGEAVALHGAVPQRTVVRLTAGVADALRSVHGAGVVHRDLKPSNVLLAADGPQVIDFGIARASDATTMFSGSPRRIGTPGFMAPEQVMGGEITAQADVFALGLLTAFAAGGRGAFGGGDADALLYRIVHDRPDLSACPDGLRDVVEACLEKDPANRPVPEQVIEACRVLSGETDPFPGAGWLPAELAEEVALRRAPAAPAPGEVPAPAPGEAARGRGHRGGPCPIVIGDEEDGPADVDPPTPGTLPAAGPAHGAGAAGAVGTAGPVAAAGAVDSRGAAGAGWAVDAAAAGPADSSGAAESAPATQRTSAARPESTADAADSSDSVGASPVTGPATGLRHSGPAVTAATRQAAGGSSSGGDVLPAAGAAPPERTSGTTGSPAAAEGRATTPPGSPGSPEPGTSGGTAGAFAPTATTEPAAPPQAGTAPGAGAPADGERRGAPGSDGPGNDGPARGAAAHGPRSGDAGPAPAGGASGPAAPVRPGVPTGFVPAPAAAAPVPGPQPPDRTVAPELLPALGADGRAAAGEPPDSLGAADGPATVPNTPAAAEHHGHGGRGGLRGRRRRTVGAAAAAVVAVLALVSGGYALAALGGGGAAEHRDIADLAPQDPPPAPVDEPVEDGESAPEADESLSPPSPEPDEDEDGEANGEDDGTGSPSTTEDADRDAAAGEEHSAGGTGGEDAQAPPAEGGGPAPGTPAPAPSAPAPPREDPPPPAPGQPGRDNCSHGTDRSRVWAEGMAGQSVRQIQCLLNHNYGNQLDTDGIFGPRTDTAVRAVQRCSGIDVDGHVGPETWRYLDAPRRECTP